MKVLVMAAHPDDETLGCGGTIAKFISSGADVRVMTFTDGGSARSKDTSRIHQLGIASRILGFKVLETFNFPDNEMDKISLLEINKSVESSLAKNKFTPDIILTHNPWCLNIDHKIVFECVQVISRNLKCKIMCFEIPSSTEWNFTSNFRPNCFVELNNEHVDLKTEALLKAYESELRDGFHARSIASIKNLMRANGSIINAEFAEKFMIIKEII